MKIAKKALVVIPFVVKKNCLKSIVEINKIL